jgi:hypothetical protein
MNCSAKGRRHSQALPDSKVRARHDLNDRAANQLARFINRVSD